MYYPTLLSVAFTLGVAVAWFAKLEALSRTDTFEICVLSGVIAGVLTEFVRQLTRKSG